MMRAFLADVARGHAAPRRRRLHAGDEPTRERRFFTARRREVYAQAATHGALGVAPLIATGIMFAHFLGDDTLALDFRHGPWTAGHAILHGLTPYVDPSSPEVATGEPFVYPAAAGVLLAPFALLPQMVAGVAFAVLCIVAVLATLFVAGVRDWRVYGAVMIWPPVITGWQWANITLVLALGVALCWRYRDRPLVVGGLIALLVSVKVFVWPLGLWLLATRRYRAIGHALWVGVALNVVSWGVIGLDEISRYDDLMHALTRLQDRQGYSLVALGLHNGLGRTAAYAAAGMVAAGATALCVRSGRRRQDLACFALSLAVTLLTTPIFWPHYYVLLIAPLAAARPRFGIVWLLPFAMWLAVTSPGRWPGSWPLVAAFAVGAVYVTLAACTDDEAAATPSGIGRPGLV